MSQVLHDSQLTQEQRSIVELRPERHHLIMGPPGSGKTQVLLHRAKWLSQRYGIPANRFSVLVYTNVLTFDTVLMPKLVETNFSRVSAEIRKRLLLVGITRATQWAYMSTFRGWELKEVEILKTAAENEDLFVKSAVATGQLTPPPAAQDGHDASEDGDDVGFL